ncbi:MAG: DUF2804 domain-containing protein [Bacteriovoracaceae bacterium]|nr:DUF2804 domain-containing protein [Deltaproteobacteria bacterium]NLW68082.1 DUF2804 domain-containing protein [Bacteriovoracaceae bacterium]
MDTLVNGRGLVKCGIYNEPVHRINYADYRLETSMGMRLPHFLRRLLANQFHFIGIIGPELMAGVAVVDLKYLSNGFMYIFDRQTGEIMEAKAMGHPLSGTSIDPLPEKPRSFFNIGGLIIEMRKDSLKALGNDISIDVSIDTNTTSPLRICTRAGYRGWVYTQKTSPIKVKGTISGRTGQYDLSSPAYWALSDWTCGFMRRQTCWNWAATASSLDDGRSLGLNLSCGVNETSFTENAFWVGGIMTKVDLVDFDYDPDDLSAPWHIRSSDRKVDLVFYPEARREEKINAFFLASRFTQMLGIFEGTLKTDEGEMVFVQSCPGFTEDHYAKW